MKTPFYRFLAALAAAGLVSGCALAPPASDAVMVNLVALNDFHGHLEASKFTYTPAPGAAPVSVQAGGIDTLAAALQAWRARDPDLLLVAAGDLIGGSPALSSMWADEPSLTALDMLGLRLSSAGNHEFDNGRKELLRQQHGGCASNRPDKACKFTPQFGGVHFSYLAANVIETDSGTPLLPAYRVETVHGIKVAFIGAVLRNTASVVLASGIEGLNFVDEADAINAAVAHARAEGADVFVVLIHEGAHTDENFAEPNCSHLAGPVVDIAKRLDPAIRLIISGHTHTGFLCKLDGRVITQAEMGGHLLSRIKLAVDPMTHAVRDIEVANVIMTPGAYPAVPRMQQFLASVKSRSDAVLATPVARIGAASIGRVLDKAGEAPLGDLDADAVLAATRAQGVQIGFMNIAGLRHDLDSGPDRLVTQGQLQAVLPFSNTLVLMDLTGTQLLALLEQQWVSGATEPSRSMLQISQGFTYRWSAAAGQGAHIVPGSARLDGKPIEPGASYRIAVNNFLAEGGDNLPMFREGTKRNYSSIRDVDVLRAYLIARDQAGQPAGSATAAGRIVRVD